jgi:hypothetical protein
VVSGCEIRASGRCGGPAGSPGTTALGAPRTAELPSEGFAGNWFNKPALQGRRVIHLKTVQGYRRICSALAGFFDQAALDHILTVAGPAAGW